jgi:tetratricopeptide (TPR) repeat protein
MPERLVFTGAAGRVLTTRDLEGSTGQVDWQINGGHAVPAEAAALHEQARAAGARGDYDGALRLLDRAHSLAPGWPYPVYDAAFTYLLQGDTDTAEQCYAEVDRLAPRGFFTCKTTLDSLRRERAGELPAGFCRAFVALESLADPAQKKAVLEGIVARFPAFAPAWMELANLLDDAGDRLHAIGRGLAGAPDAETRGMLLLNKALVLHQRGDRDAAIAILGELALDPASTLTTDALARATLAQLTDGREPPAEPQL